MTETFTCDGCGGTFPKEWSDEEAIVEMKDRWGEISVEDCGVLCDVCDTEFQDWFRQHGRN